MPHSPPSPSGMVAIVHTAISATAAVLAVGIIVWGLNACSARDDALRHACIEQGGSVVPAPGGSFSCVHGGFAK